MWSSEERVNKKQQTISKIEFKMNVVKIEKNQNLKKL